jgi:hypothetical protein
LKAGWEGKQQLERDSPQQQQGKQQIAVPASQQTMEIKRLGDDG